MTRVAIVGAGPGGLFAAWHLMAKAGSACAVTIFEADDRIGGKILSRHFPGAGGYEAGLAELYDYSAIGPDPLRHMIESTLRLGTRPIAGGGCVLEGHVVRTVDDLAARFGAATRDAVLGFHRLCSAMMSPTEFYGASMAKDNAHPWSGVPAETILADCVPDEQARRYLRAMAHSDVAASLHQTDGLNLLKNVVMDIPGYMSIYSVVGGNEAIVRRLKEELDAEVRLNTPVRSIEAAPEGGYRLLFGDIARPSVDTFDIVVLALPLNALSLLEWRSPALHRSMKAHVAHFDRPGHYLRVTLLFDAPFWREELSGSWWMLDAFDGCCVYDEGARQDGVRHGIIGILIAGNAALELANQTDDRIRALCLEALPTILRRGRHRLLDARIHRWLASVNAVPGGRPLRNLASNHRPGGDAFPNLHVVGDYLFDSTLNGTLDSADAATDMIVASLVRRRCGVPAAQTRSVPAPTILDASYLASLIDSVWGGDRTDRRVLHLGAESPDVVHGLRAVGVDAWGVRLSRSTGKAVPTSNEPFLVDLDAGKLPFPPGYFDVVYEAGFHRVPPGALPDLAREVRRVSRKGLVLGSPTTDLPLELIERYRLLSPSETFASRWELSETLLEEGFELALADARELARAWDVTLASPDATMWFEEPEGLLYAVYATNGGSARRGLSEHDE